MNLLGSNFIDNKNPKDTKVVVAMSGGVDSSVVAALLHEQGYNVVGVTLQLYNDIGEVDAQYVAEKFGFPHYVLNCESNFRQNVITDFADSYMRGETPVPCIRCNQTVKFRDLLKFSHDLGADCLATGHYTKRIVNKNGVAELYRAQDHDKDQSYFLFATTQEQLNFLRFPLGNWSKDKTRAEAQRFGLSIADKQDSQDICFVPDGDYAKIVKSIYPEAETSGDILHEDGRILGQHKGIIHYTIGQRRGIGIGGGISKNNAPFYVINIDANKNQVIVGSKESLARDVININECNWLVPEIPKDGMEIDLKFRSVMKPVGARLIKRENRSAEIYLNIKQYGIASGQAAVCYDNDRLIGGGWIMKNSNGHF
ncbi:MAG: tRNA 2-thiouridine(34) synthase MnmA [Alphaproteobacteria bacterium]|nr:tRNA 2-thiouridine(34) synthase MnmA [Alphaproteobacteria bacterium]